MAFNTINIPTWEELNAEQQNRKIYYELAPIYYKYLEDFENKTP